jgi:hypothetical protein
MNAQRMKNGVTYTALSQAREVEEMFATQQASRGGGGGDGIELVGIDVTVVRARLL